MKKYKIEMDFNREGKIPAIKMFRMVLDLGLRDAKEFVEQVIMESVPYPTTFILTEAQLGRLLIFREAQRGKEINEYSTQLNIISIFEYVEPFLIDLTQR